MRPSYRVLDPDNLELLLQPPTAEFQLVITQTSKALSRGRNKIFSIVPQRDQPTPLYLDEQKRTPNKIMKDKTKFLYAT